MVLPNGIYLIENNAATQIWTIPDNIILSNFTLGSTYMTFYAQSASPKQSNELEFEAFPGGFGFATPIGTFSEDIPLEGFVDSIVERNLFVQFFAKHRKMTQPRLYLIVKLATGEFIKFPAPDDLLKDYAPGYIKDLAPSYAAADRQFTVRGVFQIVWGGAT